MTSKQEHSTIKGMYYREDRTELTGYPIDEYICYFHRDPETQDVVYVGEGKYQRAYDVAHRSLEHSEWLVSKLKEGYTLADIVDIRSTGFTKEEARGVEKHNIQRCLREGCKLFNHKHNPNKSPARRPDSMYEAISPAGTRFIIKENVKEWIAQHELSRSEFYRVARGKAKTTKGWKIRIIT